MELTAEKIILIYIENYYKLKKTITEEYKKMIINLMYQELLLVRKDYKNKEIFENELLIALKSINNINQNYYKFIKYNNFHLNKEGILKILNE